MKSTNPLWDLAFQTIQELETERGVLASGKEEIYGCIFGRDSLITALKLLRVYKKTGHEYFLTIVKKILENLLELQGREVNIESGEEPGKCIHEYRPERHEHLTQKLERPWYVYPDQVMRNYDSVDSTPLLLIALDEYFTLTKDTEFFERALPHATAAVKWLLDYADTNGDGFIDYQLHPNRNHGGLMTQSWMDSQDSVFHEDGTVVTYPIAPVEAQAYTYVALRAWSKYLALPELGTRAENLKTLFNEKFVLKTSDECTLAFAIDGNGKPLTAPRSSMGHCLWAVFQDVDGSRTSILQHDFIPHIVRRLMEEDLFESSAGIRTLSKTSNRFHPSSYHNGSIWPHDTSIIIEGFENFGFVHEARQVRGALLKAYEHFQTPIELFVYNERFDEYRSPSGQAACKKQAWSAAALLSEVA